jgi:putative drug exporter of the RND superfamily
MSRSGGGLLERHGRRMARWRWAVIPVWILILVAAVGLAGGLGDVTSSETTLPGSEAQRGVTIIENHFSGGREYTDVQPVFRNRSLTVADPAYRAAVTAALARGARVVPGTRVVSYFSTGSRDLVGQDGHMTFATLRLPLATADAKAKVPALRAAIGTPAGFEPTLVGGDAASSHDLDPIVEDDLAGAELIVLPVALLILLIFFGSLVSALVPLLMAATTIALAFAGTYLVGQAMTVAEQVTNVITLVGLAIGVDYAMLVVSRFREELRAGRDRVDAVGRTVATAGRAVLLSGFMVAVGLAVLVALPVPFIRSMGLGGMLVPASAVLAGLTLLPALLGALGPRIDALRVYPRRWRLRDGAVFGPLSRRVTGRAAAPLALLVLTGLVAAATTFPDMSLHQDSLADAPRVEATRAGLLVRAEWGGATNPNVYVIDTGRANGVYAPRAIAGLDRVAAGLRAERATVSGVTWPRTHDPEAFRRAAAGGLVDATGRYALMSVAPRGDELSASARRLNALMEHRKAEIAGAVPGSTVTLTGAPAAVNDFNDAIYGPFPWLVAGVLLVTFVGLMRAFRSWLVPLMAVLLSGLGLLATYGLLYLVFQRGVGAEAIGVHGDVRGIAGWVPVFVFAFLFGISMDYQVFLVERMRELRDGGASNREAVRLGLQRTGRVIVAAAAIMVTAFAGFVSGRLVEMQEFGVALAAAVAVDALLIRCVLVPAAMRLAGERNWTLPPRLARAARVRPREARTIGEPIS